MDADGSPQAPTAKEPVRRGPSRRVLALIAVSAGAAAVLGPAWAIGAVVASIPTVRAEPAAVPSTTATPTGTATPTPSAPPPADNAAPAPQPTSAPPAEQAPPPPVTPPSPPEPPAQPPYTDADAIDAVASVYGGTWVYDGCQEANSESWVREATPPPPAFPGVGVLGFAAGALADGSGGWVTYYVCE